MNKQTILAIAGATLLCGCVNEYGQFRPPDPLGHALFDLIDPPPRSGGPAGPSGPTTPNNGAEYVVTSDIPAPQPEARPSAPAHGLVWVAGYWSWNGSQWAWVRGRWMDPPHPGARWVVSRYYVRNGQRYWSPGYWR